MKTGNISNVSDIAFITADVAAQQNSVSANGKDSGFGDIMNKKSSQSLIPDFGASGNSMRNSKAIPKTSRNDVRQIIKSDRAKVQPNTGRAQAVKAADKISAIVSDKLGISEEELASELEKLGLTVQDLVKPQNMAALIAEVMKTDVTSIVTDSSLGEMLSDLVNIVNDIINDAAIQSGMTQEDFDRLMDQTVSEADEKTAGDAEQAQQAENVSENSDVTTAVIKDEATGKEIKVTVESTTGDTVEAKATGEIKETQESGKQNSDDSHGKGENAAQNMAHNILDNLTQSVTGDVGETSFSGSSVNGTDVLSQVLEAVKVNINSDTSSMELQLTPEHLGKINLTVSATKEGILTASIVTQNEAVKAALENQIVQLREALNNQGLKIQEVHVTVASQGFDTNDGTGSRNEESRKKHTGSRHFRTDAEIGETEEQLSGAEQTMMEIKGNSVSYTA